MMDDKRIILSFLLILVIGLIECSQNNSDSHNNRLESNGAKRLLHITNKIGNPLHKLVAKSFQSLERKFNSVENLIKEAETEKLLTETSRVENSLELKINETEHRLEEMINDRFDQLAKDICKLYTCSEWSKWTPCDVFTFGDHGLTYSRTRECGRTGTNCTDTTETKEETENVVCITLCPHSYNVTTSGYCVKLHKSIKKPQELAEQQCQTDGGHLINIDSSLKSHDIILSIYQNINFTDVPVINPFFNRTSFKAFQSAEDALFALKIQLEFKPQSLSDGIILYKGNDKDSTGDFMAIVQNDGFLEFRFDTGSGAAVIRSRNPLRVNEWTRVTATRKNRKGTLVVNNDDKVTVEIFCDQRGSLSTRPNPITRRCDCRENAYRELCDTCKADTFYLSSSYELGCVRCFCMGVSKRCQSTTWNRAQIGVSFLGDESGVKITDMNGKAVQDQRLIADTNNRELVYRTRYINENTLYWSLPTSFLGDKVTAYGGSLKFTIRYSSRQGQAVSEAEPLVKISGNDITLIHITSQEFQSNRPQPVNIMMYEQNWYRSDGQPATREHLLVALADLDSILIRATFEKPQVDTGLRDVTMDIAESRQTRQDRAYAVESCQCPVGYRGLSCEDCDTGYTRSGGGLYLGLCEPCRCNGHSNECDQETGFCRNCQHNTAGDNCEFCTVGFYGTATVGRHDDCQKCPCPLTESPNQFSPTCILDTDGQVTCTACPAGHTGRRCETCAAGYSGNPSKVGDYCRIVTGPSCDCDTRGTVPDTQCDEVSQQCQCKPYVQGLRCARCREGHFYLEANNAQGCLTCFCSGITNQCTSSNYDRESLRPQLGSDGRHNFALINRRMKNIISDGFVVDANRNQVTFNQFEGTQHDRESLFFHLPAKFRGDRVTSYGGYLRFTLEFSARPDGRTYRDVDLEVISKGQGLRLYHLFEPGLQEGRKQTYKILLRESSFNDLRINTAPTRETFMNILSDVAGILIRATYHQKMASVTLRDVSMDTAVPTPTNLGGAPMVEDCRCPEGYTGLSCQRCADGYLSVSDGRGGVGRCVRCNCNEHGTSCDPDSGRCLECQHTTEGDRCERCAAGFYGDPTSGTPNDCRPCPCPLTTPPNQFSRTCYLAEDSQVTCDRCPTGYTGRQCGVCVEGFIGDPTQPGGSCRRGIVDLRPDVYVSPVRVEEPEGSFVVFQCQVSGEGPFNVVWSRLDSRQLPDRATVSPRYSMTIRNLVRDDTGRYICTATNRYGVIRQDVELKVNVEVCIKGQILCDDKSACITAYQVCDGITDCDDNGDESEENCGIPDTGTTSLNFAQVAAGKKVEADVKETQTKSFLEEYYDDLIGDY